MNGGLILRRVLHSLLPLLALGHAVAAKTIYVEPGGKPGLGTIQAAVDSAEDGDTIILAEGIYTGEGNHDIVIEGKRLTIQGPDPNAPDLVAATVIDCGGSAGLSRRAFELPSGEVAHLTLAGLTIANGHHAHAGGAILVEDGTLNLLNCHFNNNVAPWWGGAIHAVECDVIARNCTFANNLSENGKGGAVYCDRGSLSVTATMFDGNTGSAIKLADARANVTDCVFQYNTGDEGGAIDARVDTQPDDASHLDVSECTFIRNSASKNGGALHDDSVSGSVTRCSFTANDAGEDGGAIYHDGADPSVANCIFAENTAVGSGGAAMNWFNAEPSFVNCTFVGNRAAKGGAIASERLSHPLVSHCILWDNQADQGDNLHLADYEWGTVYETEATVEYSDVQGLQNSVFVAPASILHWELSNTSVDPLFTGPLQDDYRLSPDSPCIDRGDPDYLPGQHAVDFDGLPRRFGRAVDLGAFEFQGLGPVYRFWSALKGKHFYTLSGAERDKLVTEYPDTWTYEEIAYYAYYEPMQDNLRPVYRFWSPVLESHFWTISEAEKDWVLKAYPDDWVFEGVAFYAYAAGEQRLSARPVYRFWSDQLGHHFYTISEAEKNLLLEKYPTVWAYEGIGWYAFHEAFQPERGVYDFTAGQDGARYNMTLSATVDGQQAQINLPNVDLQPVTTQMQMSIDFTELTATMREFRVQTDVLEHAGVITTLDGKGVAIPFNLSMRGSFEALSQRGPFAVDPETGVFADFVKAPESRDGLNETFRYFGSARLGQRFVDFDHSREAIRLELDAAGAFESFKLLPDGIVANMPFTFQWHRQYVKDLLVETTVDGRLVQLYAVYTYVATQGIWQGRLAD
jgi:predicted outer membrane repeat protein